MMILLIHKKELQVLNKNRKSLQQKMLSVKRQKQREYSARNRAKKTAEQKQIDSKASVERMTESRANRSSEKIQQDREIDAQRKATFRDNQTPQQQQMERDQAKHRMAGKRLPTKTGVSKKDGLRSQEILNGSFKVPLLEKTDDAIGSMSNECIHCGALKFQRETSTTCCSDGKFHLEPFPKPTSYINDLWQGNSQKSKLFRENSRIINNAVCITSLKTSERRVGFTPSVVFQGRVHHRIGSLLPDAGDNPKFAQLYVFDPTLETTTRFENMVVQTSMSLAQRNMLKEILLNVQNELHENNPFVKDFLQIMELPEETFVTGKIVIAAKNPSNEHKRRYNCPTNLQEVSILTNGQSHDLVLQRRGGGLQYVSDLNPKGMPLHFVLLFPYGTHGWDPESKHKDGKRRVTTREFYAFHLNIRRNPENQNFLHRSGKLFQEWICMAWTIVENQRLNYQRMNQKALRADSYKNLKEATEEKQRELAPRVDGLFRDDHQQPSVGRRIILSSSFSGSPRWYNAKFQDGMAIVREFHKPDFFVTMTCNPKWPEIAEQLLPGQAPQDRPDIVARVFKQKKDQLMKDLTSGQLFGQVVAHMHVTEFQKRGLPHEHILLILANCDRPLTPESVDEVVVAEIPPIQGHDTDPEDGPSLEEIVLLNMVHGPCGQENPSSPCMENGKCTKGYPKEFLKKTVVDPDNFYAIYRRRSPSDGGRSVTHPKSGKIIDNRWIVPYNPHLSSRFNCHINVECCSSPKAAKYLYKYVTKGNDRAMVATETEDQPRNEIMEYEDLRSVGSSEATWHLMSYPITERHPAVLALRVHLQDQHQVIFDFDTEDEALEKQRDTELTAFFTLNNAILESDPSYPIASMSKYVDMPKTHVYDKAKKEWRLRKRGEPVIGRVHTVHPVAGETYFLRVLLHDDHCKGKRSFEDMLTLSSGKICSTYKDVCTELGLLSDDKEWQRILEESAVTRMCPQIRELFVTILIFCHPSDPLLLFNEFWGTWTDDFEQRSHRDQRILTENQKKTMVLLDLDLRLQSFESNLSAHGLPVPSMDDLAQVESVTSTEPAIIREELDYNVEELVSSVQEKIPMFTEEQSTIFSTVIDAVKNGDSLQVFIDARGGCGKTFLLNTILKSVRSMEAGGCTALAMATTGIAANLLRENIPFLTEGFT